MSQLSAVIQTGIKDVGMVMETLSRHVKAQGQEMVVDKMPKNPRKAIVGHKKGQKAGFLVSERHRRGIGGLVG